MNDFKKLMANTTQYVGYIDVDGHRVYGSLFIPDGVAHGYVVPNGVTVRKSSNGNITNIGQLKESGKRDMKLSGNQLYVFTKERINEGIFFPAAGTIGAYNDGNPQLIYQETEEFIGQQTLKTKTKLTHLYSVCSGINIHFLQLVILLLVMITLQKQICTASVQSTLVSKTIKSLSQPPSS